MKVLRCKPARLRDAGFTLAEAAVTIAIVAIVLTLMLQGLEGAKFSAAHTRAKKTAYELGVGMLGEITSGLWLEEIESGMSGSFADLDEPDYFWDLALGDDVLDSANETDEEGRPFDNFEARRDWEDGQDDGDEDEDEETNEPFEKIRLRVTYPAFANYPSEITLEQWVPWDQVYGEDEEEDEFGTGRNAGDGPGPGDGSAPDNGGEK